MSILCPTLNKAVKHYVAFDVNNPEHLKAFQLLCIGTIKDNGSVLLAQHPTLRFDLETPFEDVRSMMFSKVGQSYMRMVDNVTLVRPGIDALLNS